MPQSASSGDFNVSSQNITIKAGDLSTVYTVHIAEDDIPEMTEEFHLVLTATSGDTVLHSNSTAVVLILPNDDPGGVVQFAIHQSGALSFKEKDTAFLRFFFHL